VSLVPAVVELRVDGRVDGRGGRLLDMLVAQKLGGELRLGLGHTGPCAAVDGVNLGDHQHIGHRHRGKTEGHQQQQDADDDARRRAIELPDGSYETAVAHLAEAHRLHNRVQRLKEVDEEEDHEVEARVVAECLVRWSEPEEEAGVSSKGFKISGYQLRSE